MTERSDSPPPERTATREKYEVDPPSRRDFLRYTAGASVFAGTVGTGLIGSSAAQSTSEESLLVNDYDGDPTWPSRNDLGKWNGAGSFANGGGSGAVVDGALRLEYENAGWFASNVGRDVSSYSRLEFVIRGDSGNEGDEFQLKLGGVSGRFSEMTDGSIGTSFSTVSVDLESIGVDRTSLPAVRFNFWNGASGSGAVEIEEIRFASGDSSTATPTPDTPTPDTPTPDTPTPDTPTPTPDETISVELADATIAADGSTEATVVLSGAPNGLSGYDLSVSVGDTSVATISGASYPDSLSPVGSTEGTVTDDGKTANLKAADLRKNVEPGATDVTLATLTLSGQSAGSTDLSVSVSSIDDDSGSNVPVTTSGTSLTVGGGTPTPDTPTPDTPTPDTPTPDTPTPGTPTPAETISVELGDATITPDGTTKATVVLSEAPNGLSGYDVDVSLPDASVAKITSVSYPDSLSPVGSTDGTITGNGTTAHLKAADLRKNVDPGASDVTLATITLTGVAAGDASLSVSVGSVDDDSGSSISVTGQGATLTVADDTEQTLGVELSVDTIKPDGTATASVVLSKVPKGLSGYRVKVSIAKPSIAEIKSVSYPDALSAIGNGKAISEDGETATLAAADLRKNVEPGATNVELADLTLAAENAGDTKVAIAVESLDDDQGGSMSVQTAGTMLTVSGDTTNRGVKLNLATKKVAPDGTVTADVVLSKAPNGLSGYRLRLDVAKPSIAEITKVSYPDTVTALGSGSAIKNGGARALIQAADLRKNIDPGATDATLATITFKAKTVGTTQLDLQVQSMDDDSGSALSLGGGGAMLSVTSSNGSDVVPIDGTKPTNVDDDPTYEDINGNGTVELADLVKFYYVRDEPAITEHPDAYDFDGDGDVDDDDAVSLFREVIAKNPNPSK